jgi:hypothetical protein
MHTAIVVVIAFALLGLCLALAYAILPADLPCGDARAPRIDHENAD